MAGKSAKYPNNLKLAMKQAGFTVKEVAEETAIPLRTLSDYCAGNVPIPRKRLDELANVIGCSTSDLVPAFSEFSSKPTDDQSAKQISSDITRQDNIIMPKKQPETTRITPYPLDIGEKQTQIFANVDQWSGKGVISEGLQIPLQTILIELEMFVARMGQEQYRYSRRQILAALAALPLTTLSSGQALSKAYMVEIFLPQCAASLVACNQLMRSQDFLYVEHTLARLITPLIQLLHQETVYQATVAHLATQCYLLFGVLESHKLNWSGYKSSNEHALEMSRMTSDLSLQTVTFVQLAMTFFHFEQPQKALSLYQEAIPLVKKSTPLVQSDFYVKQAVAYAQSGQAKEAQECLALAHASFPEKPENDTSFLFADFGSSSFISWKTTAQLQLVKHKLAAPEDAWETLSRTEHLHFHGITKGSTHIQNLQAETALALNDLELFVHFLTLGAQGAKRLKSARRLQEAIDCYRLARKRWPNERVIQDLVDVFVEGGEEHHDKI